MFKVLSTLKFVNIHAVSNCCRRCAKRRCLRYCRQPLFTADKLNDFQFSIASAMFDVLHIHKAGFPLRLGACRRQFCKSDDENRKKSLIKSQSPTRNTTQATQPDFFFSSGIFFLFKEKKTSF